MTRLLRVILLLGLIAAVFFLGHLLGARSAEPSAAPTPAASTEVRPTASVLLAVRGLARLETTELYVEKVIDLREHQNHLFGLVHADDAILLVAAGAVVLGVDLDKVRPEDVVIDEATGAVQIHLPEPEILSSRLDEKHTYVYTRTTDLLARRNEQLEAEARKAALESIEQMAREGDAHERAKQEAQRQLTTVLGHLGLGRVSIVWRPTVRAE